MLNVTCDGPGNKVNGPKGAIVQWLLKHATALDSAWNTISNQWDIH